MAQKKGFPGGLCFLLFSATGPVAASVSVGWKAIPRANTRSAGTIPVPNTGKLSVLSCMWFVYDHPVNWSFLFQLIQDEIKALVQLQNRQACVQPHTDFSPTPLIKTAAASILAHRNVISDNGSPPAPAQSLFGFPSPDLQGAETGEKQATTVLSSGYGTLSTLEMSRELSGFRGEFKEESQTRKKPHWSSDLQEDTETPVARSQQEFVIVEKINPSLHQRRTTGYVQTQLIRTSALMAPL